MDFNEILAQVQQLNGGTLFSELTETSVRANQPPGAKIPLKPHQLALLHKCFCMENDMMDVLKDKCRFRTRFGIIADKTGSGKSMVILSLLNNSITQSQENQEIIKSFGLTKGTLFIRDSSRVINTSLLVIPHNLVHQWNTYVASYSDSLRSTMVCNKKTFEKLESMDDLQQLDLIIVTSKYFPRIAQIVKDSHYKLARIIYDEIDSMSFSTCDVKACFTWYVTASYLNLLYPKGYGRWDRNIQRYVSISEGIQCTGYVKNLFYSLMAENGNASSLGNLVIAKNMDAFVDASFQLPEIIHKVVRCKTPRSINILSGIVDRNIIECLNSDNVAAAIEYINPAQKSTEENIITLLLAKYTRNINNIDTMLEYVTNRMQYDNETQRTHEIARLTKNKDEFVSKVKSITARIKETNTCCICYDDIQTKTVMNCCSNAFCFKCVTLWMNQSSTCPLCKTRIDTASMLVVSSSSSSEQPRQGIEQHHDPTGINDTNDKIQNLMCILKKCTNNEKVLIFSYNDEMLVNIQQLLQEHSLRHSMLKGNHVVINSHINEYRNGNLNILLVNPRNYGSGMNLENTTDIILLHKFDNEIESQVIGRAQRYGRESPLRIWYLLYENEIPSSQ